MFKTWFRLTAPALVLGAVTALHGANTAQSSAYGEFVKINVLPLLGSPVQVTSGPLPSVAGSAPPTYSSSNQVASVTVSASLLSTLLRTGILTVHASSNVPDSNTSAADASVANVRAAVSTLVGLTADAVQSSVNISGTCSALTTTGTTTLANAKLSGLLGISLAANPAPNTVVLDAAGVRVVLNEQIATGNGTSSRGLTVNAIHISLTNAVLGLGLVGGDIIISQSQASLQCGPSNADLTLTKAASPNPVVIGENITYTLIVANHGPDGAPNTVVTDSLPAGVTFVSATPTQGTCSGTTTVTCNLGTIAGGDHATITIIAKAVDGSQVTNTATAKSDVPDSNTNDNTASVTTTISHGADMGLTAASTPASVNPGENITYTFQVTNQGPAYAPNVVFSDPLPSNVSFVSASSTQGSCSGTSTVTCSMGTLPANSTATVTVVAKALSGPQAVNTGTVQSDAPDSNPANNSASTTTPISTSADMAVTETASATSVNTGDSITYTIHVSNLGPSSAPNARLSDTLPSNVSLVSASTNQGSCSGTSSISCNFGTLAANGSATVTIVVKATAAGPATNTVTAQSDAPDANTGNNTASVTTTVQPNADMGLSASGSPSAVNPGENITYTLQVSNAGPGAATNTIVTDTLPSNVSLVSASASQGSCSGTSSLTCNLGTVAANSTATVTIVVKAVSSGQALDVASVQSDVPDPNAANNSASVTTTVRSTADMGVTASGTPAVVNPGDKITYTVQVSNAGPGAAPNTILTDMLPPNVTLVSATPSQGSCSGGATVSCNLGTVNSGGTATVTIVVTAVSAGQATNTMSVQSDLNDPNPGNNSATVVNTIRGAADLAVSETGTPSSVNLNQNVTYTVQVSNLGPGAATNTILTDVLSSRVAFVSATPSQGTCSGTTTITCNLGTLAANGSATVSIVVTAKSGDLNTNTVTAQSDAPDPNTANNTASVNTIFR